MTPGQATRKGMQLPPPAQTDARSPPNLPAWPHLALWGNCPAQTTARTLCGVFPPLPTAWCPLPREGPLVRGAGEDARLRGQPLPRLRSRKPGPNPRGPHLHTREPPNSTPGLFFYQREEAPTPLPHPPQFPPHPRMFCTLYLDSELRRIGGPRSPCLTSPWEPHVEVL